MGNSRFRNVECLRFEADGLKTAGLSILAGGVASERITRVCEMALGRRDFIRYWDEQASLAENIRNIDDTVVEDLMIKEVREALTSANSRPVAS